MLSLSLLSPTTKMVSPRLLPPPLVIFRWRKFQPFSLQYRFMCLILFFSGKQGERVLEDVGNYKQPLVWIDLEMTGNVSILFLSLINPPCFCLLILYFKVSFFILISFHLPHMIHCLSPLVDVSYFRSSIFNILTVYCVGLNVEVDRILEIACIITDGQLAKSVEVYIYICSSIYFLPGFPFE